MLYLLISCVSLILVSKSLTNKQSWNWKFLAIGFWWFHKSRQLDTASLFQLKNTMTSVVSSRVVENVAEEEEEEQGVSLLDLPDLTLECILERLPPSGLYNMAGVSTFMRDRCTSDHFWEKHMKQKWGKLIGPAAYREWELYVATASTRSCKPLLSDQRTRKGLFASLSGVFPFSLVMRQKLQSSSRVQVHDSVMSLYLSLQSGNFCFPAQVYNRENGNVGFMLSCYDAKLCYDSGTDTFQASYSPYGRTTTREESIPWDRLRAAPVDTPPRVLHVSDCLQDLKPGDHIEIQWRRSKEFLYGWWYGVIGHLEFCNGNENHCRCHHSDTIVLEFSQYTPGSRWRQMMINRECHREEGNEADGFYGGIRKLYNVEEITKWKRLWPNQVLE